MYLLPGNNMRIDKLLIKDFKNLKDFNIDFDETQMTTVLIGHNGTGKSNLIEALVIIFRNLDLLMAPQFSYDLTYKIKDYRITVKANPQEKAHTRIWINGIATSLSQFRRNKGEYLPSNIFAYYSGPSNRLESHFNEHQKRFYEDLLKGKDEPLRPFFYARNVHSQFVLMSYFSFPDDESIKFLEDNLNISALESILFVLKRPPWKSNEGDPRFWNARGVVREFLGELYDHSIAPVRKMERIDLGFRKKSTEEFLYLFVPGENINKIADKYKNNKEFFKALESTYISELIHEVKITVKMKDSKNLLTFAELSEGEQQLLTVLGLLKFTKENESLFLLDEPDTHLNPAWKLQYLSLIEKVVGNFENSHIIICTHDPLIIGGLLRSQVQIFEKEKDGKIVAHAPEIDPKGMGVAALLTSELFGLKTTIDIDTQRKIDRKLELSLKSNLMPEEKNELFNLAAELGSLDFSRTIRDPLYDKFIRAMMSRKEFQKPILTPGERREQERIAKEIVDEILAEDIK
jgi:predicted ATPase